VNCFRCGRELDLSALKNAKQKRAAHVCTHCVQESMTPEELDVRLHPYNREWMDNELRQIDVFSDREVATVVRKMGLPGVQDFLRDSSTDLEDELAWTPRWRWIKRWSLRQEIARNKHTQWMAEMLANPEKLREHLNARAKPVKGRRSAPWG
jgi:hypothetical protein